MEKSFFESDTDIDVKVLMSRIRDRVRLQATHPGRSAESAEQLIQTVPLQSLRQEIQSGALSADVINQIPQKASGTKGRIELQVKKFLKWLLHWNTRGQVDFNNSAIRSLELITQNLQTSQENFLTLQQELRNLTARSAELERKMDRMNVERSRQNATRSRRS